MSTRTLADLTGAASDLAAASARAVRAMSRVKLCCALLAALGFVVLVALVPMPSIDAVRQWSTAIGPAFPLVFLLAHALITITPVPRTFFTFAAGVLFGPALGIGVAVAATTISAIAALMLVRAIGREAVSVRLTHPAAAAVDRRLRQRGWLSVGSLRLIPAVPFSVLNYCCGVTAIRTAPYLLATVVGVLPGTVAVVLLGNALTGGSNPALLAVSAAGFAVGLIGLVVDARTPVKDTTVKANACQGPTLDTSQSSLKP
ncbi:TVP38/TMEM64 family protein [Corynebacteriales bacterium D3-21]|uniref:TVP38/TMEM64 family membrane protein n=2 Tax=Speluncibacter jeojiensis TaxID=2710754 RepID=A0A9X4M0V6_9ACTN|nr:TVP38/TMEM64 family protein [Corynebacteriales bacterium D3-21]